MKHKKVRLIKPSYSYIKQFNFGDTQLEVSLIIINMYHLELIPESYQYFKGYQMYPIQVLSTMFPLITVLIHNIPKLSYYIPLKSSSNDIRLFVRFWRFREVVNIKRDCLWSDAEFVCWNMRKASEMWILVKSCLQKKFPVIISGE